jgi:hypothetical protein
MGNVHTLFLLSLITIPLILVSCAIGLMWGIVGVAIAFTVASLIFVDLHLGFAFHIAQADLREFHAALARPFIASLVILGAIWIASDSLLISRDLTSPARLLGCRAIGVIAYGGATTAVNRMQICQLARLGRAAMYEQKVEGVGA